jgi:hypothetical protein
MHFLSMQELERKSFPISEEAKEFDIEKMLQLVQQISIDLDHQTYCVLKAQRSQHKTVKHLQELLAEMKLLQGKIERRLSEHLLAPAPQDSAVKTRWFEPFKYVCWVRPKVKEEQDE